MFYSFVCFGGGAAFWPVQSKTRMVVASWLIAFAMPFPLTPSFQPAHTGNFDVWVLPGVSVRFSLHHPGRYSEECDAQDGCPLTAVVVTSYLAAFSPFSMWEPGFPTFSPRDYSLNPRAHDLLTDVHVLKVEDGIWKKRWDLGQVHVQVRVGFGRVRWDA